MIAYPTPIELLSAETWESHMREVLALTDEELTRFVNNIPSELELFYISGIASYAELEMALGTELVEVGFPLLKVVDMKRFALVMAHHLINLI